MELLVKTRGVAVCAYLMTDGVPCCMASCSVVGRVVIDDCLTLYDPIRRSDIHHVRCQHATNDHLYNSLCQLTALAAVELALAHAVEFG